MARISDELWRYNVCRVLVIDASDDYRLMQAQAPSDFYPVLREVWLPRYQLLEKLPAEGLIEGYLYDWHEAAHDAANGAIREGATLQEAEPWYVAVVRSDLAIKG